MINKKILKEVSIKTGLPEKVAKTVIQEYLMKNKTLCEKNSNERNTYADFTSTFIIKSITEIIRKLLTGEIPETVKLPAEIEDKKIQDFIGNINNAISVYSSMSKYMEQLASGNLDIVPPATNTVLISALNRLQEELRRLVATAENMAEESITGHVNNMQSLPQAFNFMATQLQKSFDKINSQKHELQKANEALILANTMEARDMDMAVTVQRSLMPETPPNSNRWQVAYYFKPMAGVSGDFYDFYIDDNELSGISLFDVSGHGISSALISMIAKWIIYQSFHKYFNKSFSCVPLEISRELNSAIGKSDYYLTGVILKFEDNLVRYINASHPDVYIKKNNQVFPLRKSNGEQPAGMLFGMNIEPVLYDEVSYEAEPGDFILLYTDGLSECCNLTGADYGAAKLQKSFSESPPSATAHETLNCLMDNVYKFMGKDTFDDDCTVIVVKKIC
jgi:hypothetical protein